MIGNHEAIIFFDLRKKDSALEFDNSKLKLENFIQIENNNQRNYLSAVDRVHNRSLIYDIR